MWNREEITTIQARVRGRIARKKFGINQLAENKLEDYQVLIQGTDPELPELPSHNDCEEIALIGTSGLRSVEIACQLSKGSPKLIIVDNSKQVIEFWRAARNIMEQAGNKNTFLKELKGYVEKTHCNAPELTKEEFNYLERLFNTFQFSQLKGIIANTAILAQSWADKDTMVKLKNILDHHKIKMVYAYPSNIAAYVNDEINLEAAKNVLKAIEALNPTMAFHTDYRQSMVGRIPKHFFLVSDHSPSKTARRLDIEKPTPEEIKRSNDEFLASIGFAIK